MTELSPAHIIWPLLSIIASVVVIGSGIWSAVVISRRRPPLSEELAKEYATKKDLADEISDVNRRMDRELGHAFTSLKDQGSEIKSLINTVNKIQRETERTLGRIEGKLDHHIQETHR